jgi:iron(III) transport system permease protein
MKVWRVALAALLIAFAGVPLVLPFGKAWLETPLPLDDLDRLFGLAKNTLLLAGGAVVIDLPVGILLAILFARTNLPGRRFLLGCTVFALFIPLPVVVSSWQAFIGSDGFFPLWFWGMNVDRPWSAGMVPAIWVHALAGLPWVILIVSVGLRSVESELEEEALLAAGPWRVLWAVTLPRCRGAIAAAALWVGVQVAMDISVSNILLVNTFADEIHTQFTQGDKAATARTMLLTLPLVIITWILLLVLVPRLERSLPPLQLGYRRLRVFSLGTCRWLWCAICIGAGACLVLLPLSALVWKLGLAGTPRAWSAWNAARAFENEAGLFGVQVTEHLGVALGTGFLAAGLALFAAWLARASRPLRFLLLGLAVLAWVMPAPIVGIGLSDVIMELLNWLPDTFIADLLYYGKSPLPIIWVHLIRFFPFALAIAWPAVRLVPTDLRDAARLEGAGPLGEFWHVYLPSTWRASLIAALAVTALCLGEIGAGARVETPGWETFAKLLFDRMHYGVETAVAALALVLLTVVALGFILALGVSRFLVVLRAALEKN